MSALLEDKKEDQVFDPVPESVTQKTKLLLQKSHSQLIPTVFSSKVLNAFQAIDEMDRFVMWGYQAKSVWSRLGIKIYKFTAANCCHNGYTFVRGYNCDPAAAEYFSSTRCSRGKFYCVYSVAFDGWFDYNGKVMEIVWDTVIRDESRVVFEDNFKCGIDELELYNPRPISDLEEWKSKEVARHAYVSRSINNVFRVQNSMVPAMIKFRAIANCLYPRHSAKESVREASVAAQYLFIKTDPELLLEIHRPERTLIVAALNERPHLIINLQARRPDLVDDELIQLVLHIYPFLLLDLKDIKEEWIRSVFEMLISLHGLDALAKGLEQLIGKLSSKKIPISDDLLLWLLDHLPDCHSVLVSNDYDSDAVRKAIITSNPMNLRFFLRYTSRDLSEDLKWHALRLSAKSLDLIQNPTNDMILYAAKMHKSSRLTDPNAPMSEGIAILSEDPSEIIHVLPPVPFEFIVAVLEKDPTLWDRIPGDTRKEELVRFHPFILEKIPCYPAFAHLPFVAIDEMKKSMEKDSQKKWFNALRSTSWMTGEVWDYFFNTFPDCSI